MHEIAQDADPAARVVYVDREPVAVSHCLQLAEQTGLSLPLGESMLHSACEQRLGLLHVNLTPHQSLDPDLVGKVRRTLDDTALPPELLQRTRTANPVPRKRSRA